MGGAMSTALCGLQSKSRSNPEARQRRIENLVRSQEVARQTGVGRRAEGPLRAGPVTKMFDRCQHPVMTAAEEGRASPRARARWCACRQAVCAVDHPASVQSRREDGLAFTVCQRSTAKGRMDRRRHHGAQAEGQPLLGQNGGGCRLREPHHRVSHSLPSPWTLLPSSKHRQWRSAGWPISSPN
jgi:hypothetical protein